MAETILDYLFTAHPDDFQAIERLKTEQGLDTLEAIEILAREIDKTAHLRYIR